MSLQLCKMTDEATKTIVDDVNYQVFMLLSRVLIACTHIKITDEMKRVIVGELQ